MRIYCLCRAGDVVRKKDGSLGLVSLEDEGDEMGVALPEHPVPRNQLGIRQYIVDLITTRKAGVQYKRVLFPSQVLSYGKDQRVEIREHFPNVDIYECPYCDCRVAIGG